MSVILNCYKLEEMKSKIRTVVQYKLNLAVGYLLMLQNYYIFPLITPVHLDK